MAERLKITIEFNKGNVEELQFYAKLRELYNPGAIIKNVLMGKLPVSILKFDEGTEENN